MRQPDFEKDDEIYGKFGESDFIDFCRNYNLNILDVSKILAFQIADIDFLVSKNKIDFNDKRKMNDLIFSNNVSKRDIYKFEVKTDTRSYETRNIVYEVISHDFAGCGAKTMCDYFYYVFVTDENGDGSNIVKREVWKIGVKKLRELLRKVFFSGKYSRRELCEKFGLRGNNYDTNGDKVANILCNIEKLNEFGIAKRLL